MTKEENVKAISGLLNNMGIDINVIQKELVDKINAGKPVFNILYRHRFNDEEMEYRLQFRCNLLSGVYSAVGYTAVYKDKNIPVKDETTNGIYLPELDKEMQTVDWKNFFAGNVFKLGNAEIGKVDNIFMQMEQLRTGTDISGVQSYVDLMFKYFPEEAWHPVVHELCKNRIRNDIINLEYNERHPIIADYYELSGKLGEYLKALMVTEIFPLYVYGLKDYLKEHLANKGPEMPVPVTLNNAKGTFHIEVPLLEQAKEYKSQSYEITFYPLQPLPDITVSSVKIHELETLFKRVDWPHEYLPGGNNKNETFESRLNRIENDLEKLSASESGRLLSFQLQLMYWAGRPKYNDKVHPEAWSALPQYKAVFPGYIPIPDALQIMSGDAVLLSYRPQFSKEFDKWPQTAFPLWDGKSRVYVSIPDFIASGISNDHKFSGHLFTDDKNKSCNKGPLLVVGNTFVSPLPGKENTLLIKIPLLNSNPVELELNPAMQANNRIKVDGNTFEKKKKSRGLKH